MSVTVKWGRERLSFALPSRDTPLSSLRKSLAEYTHLPAFKLIHKGAVLNDDNATLAAYHIVPGSVIVLLATARPEDAPVVSDRSPEPEPAVGLTTEESALLTTIHTELATVRSSLVPELGEFLANSNPTDKLQPLRLGELLLQSLLRLDALNPERDWEHARKARKEAVKEVQGLLDSLDDTIAARKAAGNR